MLRKTILSIFVFYGALSFASNPSRAESLSVPLHIPLPFIQALLFEKLEFNEQGESTYIDGPCEPVILSKPKVWLSDDLLHIKTDVNATLGMDILGQCINLAPFKGEVEIAMEVKALQDDSAQGKSEIVFIPQAVGLVKDGKDNNPYQRLLIYIAEKQLLPNISTIKIDIKQALDNLDNTINDWTNNGANENSNASNLTNRSHLGEIRIREKGLESDLFFTIAKPERLKEEPPLAQEEYQAWQGVEDELDGFITSIVLFLLDNNISDNSDQNTLSSNELAGQDKQAEAKLMDILLNARYDIANALLSNQKRSVKSERSDAIRDLFINAWNELRPYFLNLSSSKISEQNMYQLFGFIAGGDALKALDALGPEYGVEISKDGLRRLARMLLGEQAPAAFTPLPLNVDDRLKSYFNEYTVPENLPQFYQEKFEQEFLHPENNLGNGTQGVSEDGLEDSFQNSLEATPVLPEVNQLPAQDGSNGSEAIYPNPTDVDATLETTPENSSESNSGLDDDKQSFVLPANTSYMSMQGAWKDWLNLIISPAYADQITYRGLVSDSPNTDAYIDASEKFLDLQIDTFFSNKHKVPKDKIENFKIMMRATAWKESCWRQFTGKPDSPKLLSSGAGAIGMMQINERVWRGIYDVEQLKNNVAYNFYAGAKILEYYFVDYALRKGEDTKGNPYHATYAAYNGGPGHLSRYRKDTTSASLKAIDKAFAKGFDNVAKTGRPDVRECFTY